MSAVRDQPGFHDCMGDTQPLTHVARALASSPFGALVYTFTTARGSGVLLIRAAGGGNGLPTGADHFRERSNSLHQGRRPHPADGPRATCSPPNR